jgi:lipoyl-dependent peroxiredoxin
MMKRKASAVWRGDLKSGRGTVSTESTVLKDAQYSFGTRFENGPGSNPEELIGAAHAGCFSMALAGQLQKGGFAPDTISTNAEVTLENHPQTSWTVTRIHLTTTAKVPDITPEKFAEIAEGAKSGCPISRLLKAEISLDAKLGGRGCGPGAPAPRGETAPVWLHPLRCF